jgi:hypothetical protein
MAANNNPDSYFFHHTSPAVMAAHIPDKLKAADLTRFIVRAGQLEKVKPVMAYWCM